MREFSIDGCTIYEGDCFDILPKLDIKASAVFTDMPYHQTSCAWDSKIDLARFWDMVEQKTVPNANFVLFSAGKFTVDLINSRREAYRYDLIWSKSTRCGFLNSALMPLRSHESILIFTRPGECKNATYNPQRTPSGRFGVRNVSRKSDGVYGFTNGYTSISDGFAHPSSVLHFASERGNNHSEFHNTQKPLQLLQWLILSYTNRGDTVIDPFAGSATTAVACRMLGRKCIAIEKHPKYYEMAVERLKAPYQMPMFTDEKDTITKMEVA